MYVYYIRIFEAVHINLVFGVLFDYQCGIRLLLLEWQYCTGTLFCLTIVTHYPRFTYLRRAVNKALVRCDARLRAISAILFNFSE